MKKLISVMFVIVLLAGSAFGQLSRIEVDGNGRWIGGTDKLLTNINALVDGAFMDVLPGDDAVMRIEGPQVEFWSTNNAGVRFLGGVVDLGYSDGLDLGSQPITGVGSLELNGTNILDLISSSDSAQVATNTAAIANLTVDAVSGTSPTNRSVRFQKPGGLRACVTFYSDGAHDGDWLYRFPIHQARGVPGSIGVTTDGVGLAERLTWDQIRTIHAAGWSISSHASTDPHPDMTSISLDAARYELTNSQAVIEAEIGERPRAFAWPEGKYNHETREMALQYYEYARSAGAGHEHYSGGFTEINPLTLEVGAERGVYMDDMLSSGDVAGMTAFIDEAIERGVFLHFYTHDLVESWTNTYVQVLDYAISRSADIDIVTHEEGCDRFRNALQHEYFEVGAGGTRAWKSFEFYGSVSGVNPYYADNYYSRFDTNGFHFSGPLLIDDVNGTSVATNGEPPSVRIYPRNGNYRQFHVGYGNGEDGIYAGMTPNVWQYIGFNGAMWDGTNWKAYDDSTCIMRYQDSADRWSLSLDTGQTAGDTFIPSTAMTVWPNGAGVGTLTPQNEWVVRNSTGVGFVTYPLQVINPTTVAGAGVGVLLQTDPGDLDESKSGGITAKLKSGGGTITELWASDGSAMNPIVSVDGATSNVIIRGAVNSDTHFDFDGVNDYMELPVLPDNTTTLVIDMDFEPTAGTYLIGLSEGGHMMQFGTVANSFNAYWAGSSVTGLASFSGRHVFRIGPDGFFVDGVDQTSGGWAGTWSGTAVDPPLLGNRNNSGSPGTYVGCKVYSCTVYHQGQTWHMLPMTPPSSTNLLDRTFGGLRTINHGATWSAE